MEQYIPKSALIAEIERLVNNQDSALDYEVALEDVLNIIDSLQEEPVSEELEKAANEWDAKASFTPFYMALDDNGNPYEVRQDYTTHAKSFKAGSKWKKDQMMENAIDATIGLPYENKDGGYTHLIDVSRPLPVGNNKIAIIFKED